MSIYIVYIVKLNGKKILNQSDYDLNTHYNIYLFQHYQIMVMQVVGVFQWNNVENHNRLLIYWEISI